MNKDERILTPWYAINDDPKLYDPYTARESGADGVAHKKAYDLEWELSRAEYNNRVNTKSYGINWLREITKAARNSLHRGMAYTEDDSRMWFEIQEEKGLCDVFYFYDEWAQVPLQPDDKHGIICWYTNDKTRYFTFAADEDHNLVLVEKELVDENYKKPELADNSQQFVDVLLEMANRSEGFWSENFSKAAQKVREGDLISAINLSETGGGIGSWYDTIYFESARELTNRLHEERHHALLYSINCC